MGEIKNNVGLITLITNLGVPLLHMAGIIAMLIAPMII